MDDRAREEILDDGAVRLEAALREAQRLGEEFHAALLEAERIRVAIAVTTGVSLGEALPPHLLAEVLECAGRTTAEQATEFLESSTPPE